MRISRLGIVAAALLAFAVSGSAMWASGTEPLPPVAPATATQGYDQPLGARGLVERASYVEGAVSPSDTVPPLAAGSIVGCGSCDDCCDVGTWWENTLAGYGGEVFEVGLAAGGPPFQSDGNAGLVGTLNTGFSLWRLENVRGQIGASYGIYDFVGSDAFLDGPNQVFLTFGAYKRSEIRSGDRIAWAVVGDQLWAGSWSAAGDRITPSQLRSLVGLAVNERNELGFWGAFRTSRDSYNSYGFHFPLHATNQYNAYWRHNFAFGGQSMLYFGGNDGADDGSWLFGFVGAAPLSNNLILYGNFVFSQPANGNAYSQDWAMAFGVAWSFGGKAVSPTISGRKGLPLLPVASNQSFLLSN